MSRLRTLLLLVGLVPVALAVAVLLGRSGVVPAESFESVATNQAEQFLLTTAGVLVFYAALSGWFGNAAGATAHEHSRDQQATTPESVHTDQTAVVGSTLDEYAETVADHDTPPDDRAAVRNAIRDRVHDTAVRVISTRTGCSTAKARRQIEAGSWTDDPRAAAFLGGPDAPDPPFLVRLRDWLRSDTVFTVRLEHTLDALGALRDGGEMA